MPSRASPVVPITDEKEASQLAIIERLRDELELVGYVTSHDLQSPLRIILSTCEELRLHTNLSQDHESRVLVETLERQASRMKTLMQGLLEYVRLETFATTASGLDSNEIVAAAIATLDTEIKEADAVIACEILPRVTGHRGRLTRLFAYLIENALKFRAGKTPEIRISAARKGDMLEFCIEDNGIGIDPEHHNIIFSLFQRLHTDDAYPGHGIGLALARKIVQAHGGTLWVESTPEKGSRFYFTLPAAEG